jgi:predicted CXXCH cytochrome family protein
VKCTNNDKARRLRVRAVVAYPAVSIALVVSVALALTPFGPSRVMALTPSTAATETAAATTTTSTTPSTTSTTPSPTASTTPSTTSTTPSPTANPSLSSGGVTPGAVPVDHHVLARIEGSQFQANYLPVDDIVPDAAPFQTLRVRFQLHNTGTTPITATPQLEYRTEGGGGYAVVPEKPLKGIPLHVDREWVPSLGLGGGTVQGPVGEDIVVADLRIAKEGGFAVNGHRSMGVNPDRPITLPSASYTEEEFTVTLSIDAQYLTSYELRITAGGTPWAGMDPARLRLGAPPAVRLSLGQHQGVTVGGPRPTSKQTSAAGAAYPLLSAPSKVTGSTSVSAVSSSAGSAFPAVFTVSSPAANSSAASAVPATSAISPLPSYPLVASILSAATLASSDTHGPYLMDADQCAICHSGHAGQAPNLLVEGSQSALCFTCHGAAAGANTNVQLQYALDRPVNDPAKREYYSHDALAPSTHTQSELDEFGGVPNRHSECADCHNSHKAKATPDSTQNADGWDASGRLAGVSGVSVLNSTTAGAAPTYTFLNGVTNLITREYQLCFKCHSGFTTLTPNTDLKPSQYALDKGAELNPNNASYHPVEAAGKNDTDAMKASLAGPSPYKLWNFTVGSTIRCLNCHATSRTTDATATLPEAAGGDLPPHTSANRGILLRNYQDRVLKSTNAAYSAGDFALCYVCHGEAPFAPDASANPDAARQTNFSLHSKHLTGLAGKGTGGTDIDTPGDGQGNALCVECHFRLHSTTNKVPQAVDGTRLVNFAPNVQPLVAGETVSWTPAGTTTGGSCTLTCHGKSHDGLTYGP